MSTFIKACHVSRAMVGVCGSTVGYFPTHSRIPGVSAASPKKMSHSAPLPQSLSISAVRASAWAGVRPHGKSGSSWENRAAVPYKTSERTR